MVSGLLQFVDHSDSIVLNGDVAGAGSRVDDQIVLAETELAAALAFECEPFSGIPRSEGEMAWRRLGGEGDARAVFDVVQIRRADAEAEAARARRSGRRVRAVTAAPASGESIEDLPWVPVRQSRALAVRSGALMALAALLVLALIAWDATTLVSRERALSRALAKSASCFFSNSSSSGRTGALGSAASRSR